MTESAPEDAKADRECAIQAAITEMSLFGGNLEMKVRKAIDRYEFVLHLRRTGAVGRGNQGPS